MQTDPNTPAVLLVEDSDDDAYFFRRALEKSGMICSVHHAFNGAEAIDYLQQAASGSGRVPAVMFLDLKMPVLNGFEVLEWLRAQKFPASMQVIVLSGSEHHGDKARATQLGAAHYALKPIRVGDFQRFLGGICPSRVGARV